jgi:hypothetical protein
MNLVISRRTDIEDPAPVEVMQLMDELDDALSAAFFSFCLRADIEEAIDNALLRERVATTPTLNGRVRTLAA